MESSPAPSSKANILCAHSNIKWIEAMVFDEEGKGIVNRYWSCADCGERGRV